MQMNRVNKFVLFGVLFLGFCETGLSMPQGDLDEMQNDDYEYTDDQVGTNQHIQPTQSNNDNRVFFSKSNVTVTGIVGKDITLNCDAKNIKDEVILWYKDENVISTGKNIVSPMYSLNPQNYALTIINATTSSKGHYLCQLMSQKIRMHTTLVILEHPMEAIIPESSKSSQSNSGFRASISLMLASTYGIILILRI